MIIELIAENQYGIDGPQKGDQGGVFSTHRNEDGVYYSVCFPGYYGFFFVWKKDIKVIKK